MRFISELNARYEAKQLDLGIQPGIIFNFNYDYYWLRTHFKHTPIITIINDDFLYHAKPWMKNETERRQAETLKRSNICLAVSFPLLKECLKYNKNSHLFLPWASHLCSSKEDEDKGKDKLLYWGYIDDDRIDFEILEYLAQNNIEIDMIGEIAKRKLNKHNLWRLLDFGVKIHPPLSYNSLSKRSYEYYATILPYKISFGSTMSMSNRGFKLLSLGLPLIYADLPYLIEAPQEVIWKCKTKTDFLKAAQTLKTIKATQLINNFLPEHLISNRKRQLQDILKNIKPSLHARM